MTLAANQGPRLNAQDLSILSSFLTRACRNEKRQAPPTTRIPGHTPRESGQRTSSRPRALASPSAATSRSPFTGRHACGRAEAEPISRVLRRRRQAWVDARRRAGERSRVDDDNRHGAPREAGAHAGIHDRSPRICGHARRGRRREQRVRGVGRRAGAVTRRGRAWRMRAWRMRVLVKVMGTCGAANRVWSRSSVVPRTWQPLHDADNHGHRHRHRPRDDLALLGGMHQAHRIEWRKRDVHRRGALLERHRTLDDQRRELFLERAIALDIRKDSHRPAVEAPLEPREITLQEWLHRDRRQTLDRARKNAQEAAHAPCDGNALRIAWCGWRGLRCDEHGRRRSGGWP